MSFRTLCLRAVALIATSIGCTSFSYPSQVTNLVQVDLPSSEPSIKRSADYDGVSQAQPSLTEHPESQDVSKNPSKEAEPRASHHPGPQQSFKKKLLEIQDESLDIATSQEWFEDALKIMDRAVLSKLNTSAEPSVGDLNLYLKNWGSGDPTAKESYRVVVMGADRHWYVLNAKVWGMGAVHVYSKPEAQDKYGTSIQLKADTMPDYRAGGATAFEFYPISQTESVFLTSFYRSEYPLSTYAAWQFDGKDFKQLWNSGESQLSLQKIEKNRVFFSVCAAEPTEERPCDNSATAGYAWSDGTWKQLGEATK